jgi:hypothetical protein
LFQQSAVEIYTSVISRVSAGHYKVCTFAVQLYAGSDGLEILAMPSTWSLIRISIEEAMP